MKTHLVFAAMTLALLVFVISQTNRRTLTFEQVIEQARALSEQPYEPREPTNTKALRDADYDKLRNIRFIGDQTLWRKEGLPFQIAFFIAGGAHSSQPITMFQINREGAGPVRYSPDMFRMSDDVGLQPQDLDHAGFSGFRVLAPVNKPNQLDEAFVFQGASYFRPLSAGQTWGLSARGIAVNTLGKEEFPDFTTFWVVEPSPGAKEFVLYALLDGPSLTGAYAFHIEPGRETKARIRAAIFPRKSIEDIGYAPLTSMFWFGENTSNTFGDFRPEVHDSDGLQIALSNGEWIWRPLGWAKQRQVNTYHDTNPKGFGLFQRDRDFSHYQDLEANYHQRPSLWVQPEGEWGEGEIVLMQNPTDNEFADNVVAYWRPKGGVRSDGRYDIAYTLVTFSENAGLPPIGRCVATRIDYQNEKYFRQVFLDFAGGELTDLPADAKVEPRIWVSRDSAVTNVQARKNPNDNTWRVSFTASTKDTDDPIEMRCTLDLDGKPVTETWSDTWVK